MQVCPTGIDIRKGLQYECIACAACVDACNSVMDRMQYPRGLIRYSTQHAMEGKGTHVIRPRMLVYGTLLSLLVVGFFVALFSRVPVELDVIRDRNALYREARPGYVENVYMLRVINKDDAAHVYTVDVSGLPTVTVETDPDRIEVGAGEVATVAARVEIEDGVVAGSDLTIMLDTVIVEDGAVTSGGHDVEFSLKASDAPEVATTETGRFIAP